MKKKTHIAAMIALGISADYQQQALLKQTSGQPLFSNHRRGKLKRWKPALARHGRKSA